MSTATLIDPAETRVYDDEALYEIIDGLRVEIPPMSAFACKIANRLARYLNSSALPNDGEAFVELLFHLALPVDRNRRPDVAFVSFDRWPKGRVIDPDANAWDVVPNLAVEAVSPHDLIEELVEKIDEYFRAGVQLVWVIYPKQKRIEVHESPTSIRVLTDSDTLDGGKVLPQFHLPLKDLFVD